jgi:hypothetical protein
MQAPLAMRGHRAKLVLAVRATLVPQGKQATLAPLAPD